jgi:ornithine cyclodeaminase
MSDHSRSSITVAPHPKAGAGTSALALVNTAALAEIVSMADAIELTAAALKEISSDLVSAPERNGVPVAPEGKLVLMPGAMAHLNRFGLKVLSLFPNAADHGLPGHQGLMLLFDAGTGRPLCALDSHALTGLRTAAASAVATRALSRTDSRCLALIGCGSLAPLHAQAIALVRPLDKIIIWGRTPANARRLADECADRLGVKSIVAPSVQDAIAQADIVCTLTSSDVPVVEGRWLQPGQHFNLVGASTRASREVDDTAVERGRFIVDCRAHALSQAGELRHAIASGRVTEEHVVAEIGEVLAGRAVGRPDPQSITLYKSLGHVAQDIRVADAAFSGLNRSQHVVYVDW